MGFLVYSSWSSRPAAGQIIQLGLWNRTHEIDKIAFPDQFAKIVSDYEILPGFLIKIVAVLLPWAELILGVFIITGIFTKESAILILILLLIFASTIVYKASTGELKACGCFSTSSGQSAVNIVHLLVRNAILIFNFKI